VKVKKDAIKAVLFTVVVAGTSAHASVGNQAQNNTGDLQLIETLSVNNRAHYYKAIAEYLKVHPEIADDAVIFAIDNRGAVYVLDKSMVQLAKFGAPSCCD
jgi:hypothetical protein